MQVVGRRKCRNKVSYLVRPHPQVLDTEVFWVFRTLEDMLGDMRFPTVTFRAGRV